MAQVPAPQHPRVEAERVPVLRAEEALRGDLQRVQRQPAGALRVRPGLLEHHVRPGRVQSPSAASLEAGAEDPGGGGGRGRVQGLREPERRGPDGLIPGAAAAASTATAAAGRLLPDQRLNGEALLVIAVLEHCKHLELSGERVRINRRPVSPVPGSRGAQIPGFPRRAMLWSPPVRKSREQIPTDAPERVRSSLSPVSGAVSLAPRRAS